MKIKEIKLRSIFDSRAEPTIEVSVKNESGREFGAQTPSGKSRGKREAAVFDYKKCARVLSGIKNKLLRRGFGSIEALDKFLIKTDGTDNKSKLGGNLMLGLSVAFSRALAFSKNKEIWEVLSGEFFNKSVLHRKPYIFSNLINGGVHANNNLNIQEYLVVVEPKGALIKNIENLIALYRDLGSVLGRRLGGAQVPIGDEGGYSVNFKNNFEPLKILNLLIVKRRLKNFKLGLDAAASEFYSNGKYWFGGKKISSEELAKIYAGYFRRLPRLASVEDPFAETDFYGFGELCEKIGGKKLIVGDDLTATNPELTEQIAENKLANAVIIKPNQIGTITESCEAIKTAHSHKFKTIVSHRSGETEDNFIIELARASGAYGVKIGAPQRERMFKFNELLRVYSDK
jgi:enolase